MLVAQDEALKPIGPWVKGEIVGYVQREAERVRALVSMRRFHIVQTQSQQEQNVAKEIEDELGMAAYVPLEPASVRVNARKHRKVMRPMFRGYIFAAFDPDSEPWQNINDSDIQGVIRLLKIDLRPVSVSPAVMERIRAVEAQLACGRSANLPPIGVKVGDTVRLVDCGAYTGMFLPVTEVNHAVGRICVALDLIGRPSPFWVNPEQVEVV